MVLFTGNWDDAFSLDGGKTFAELSPFAMMSGFSGGFCCDQVVQYVPGIDRFIWLLQGNADPVTHENEYRIAFASPASVKATRATVWNYYDLTPKQLNFPGGYFDYPEMAVGDSYLYITFDVLGPAGKAVIVRIPLASFAVNTVGTSAPAEFVPVGDGWWIRPVQNVASEGLFAWQSSTSDLAVIGWSGSNVRRSKVAINSIPTENRSSIVPGGTDHTPNGPQDWLRDSSKWGWHIYGATEANNQIWLTWNAGRDYRDAQGNITQGFPQSHIEGAVIDATSLQLVRQFAIYDNDFAYQYPMLATNGQGQVGIVFAAGGGTMQVQPGVGFLSDPQVLKGVPTGVNPSNGSGGHYMGIRPTPDGQDFAGGVFAGMTGQGQAFYVRFRLPPCQSLINAIQDVNVEIDTLITDPGASDAVKQRMLFILGKQLRLDEAELKQCEAQHP